MPTIDFDAYRAEQKEEPLKLRLGGKEYLLPPSLPAPLALDLIALRKEHGDSAKLAAEDVERFARKLLGDSAEEIISKLSLAELGELLQRLLSVYAPPNPASPEEKEAPASP